MHNDKKEIEKNNQRNILNIPPVPGEFANWAGVNQSDLQTIIDFGFVQPAKEGQAKVGVIIKRIILPPKIAKELGEILIKNFKKDATKK